MRTRCDRGTGAETVELMQKLYRIHGGRKEMEEAAKEWEVGGRVA